MKTTPHLINLHDESLYLRGARDMLRTLLEKASEINFTGTPRPPGYKLYDKATADFLLQDREHLRRFLEGETLRFCSHERNPRGKLIRVQVCFETDYKKSPRDL